MATAKHNSRDVSTQDIDECCNLNSSGSLYAGQPMTVLVESALEMANDIRIEREQFYILASTIRDNLAERDGEDSPDINSLRLAEVLEGMLLRCGQQLRLIECLGAIRIPPSAQPTS